MNITKIKQLVASINSTHKLTPIEELLLNAVESLLIERDELKKEIQELKDEIRRMKGEQGKPKIKPNNTPKKTEDYSSEKERKTPKVWKKRSKKNKIPIHRTEIREVDKKLLPEDAVFKGYNEVVIQNIKIIPDNICFKLATWYSAKEHKTFIAKIDEEFSGSSFSPELKALIIDLYIQCRMSEFQIICFLNDKGIIISEGQISNIIIKDKDSFHQEIENAFQEGLKSSIYQNTDDTGARHNGQNGSTMIVCNPLYTRFFTTDSKSRFNVIKNLNGGEELPFTFNEFTTNLLKQSSIAHWTLDLIESLEGKTIKSLSELEEIFRRNLWGELPPESNWNDILYITKVASYLNQDIYKPVPILICDDAPQFKIANVLIQLCWVHLGRNFKVLNPYSAYYQEILENFLADFWCYYHRLLDYKIKLTEETKKQLSDDFDELFSRKTGYEVLDKLIKIKLKKKMEFLLVLEYPQIPIHNNHAEQQLRGVVTKKNVSGGTKTDEGRMARDTWMSLLMTCKKLDISFSDYLKDRFGHKGNIPALDELIREKMKSDAGFT